MCNISILLNRLFIKNKVFIFNFLAQFLNAIVTFFFVIISSNFMGAENRGKFGLLSNFNAISLLFLNLGFPSVIIYFLNKKIISYGETFYSGLVLTIIQTLLCFFIFHSYFNQKIIQNEIEIIEVVLFFCFFFNNVLVQILISRQIYLLQNLATLIINLFIIMIFFYLKDNYLNYKLQFVYFLTMLLQIFLTITYLIKLNIFNFEIAILNFSTLDKIFKYSFFGYIGNLAQTFVYRGDIFFLEKFINYKSLGSYSLSLNLAQSLWILPMSMSSILYTKISLMNNYNNIHKIIIKTIKSLILIQLFVTLLFVISIYPINKYFLNSDLKKSIDYIYYILPGIFIFSFSIILGSYFSGVGRQEINTYGALIGFFIFIILIYPTVKYFGITGAIITSAISYSSNTFYMFIKYIKIKNQLK